jgi:hypothetical protein
MFESCLLSKNEIDQKLPVAPPFFPIGDPSSTVDSTTAQVHFVFPSTTTVLDLSKKPGKSILKTSLKYGKEQTPERKNLNFYYRYSSSSDRNKQIDHGMEHFKELDEKEEEEVEEHLQQQQKKQQEEEEEEEEKLAQSIDFSQIKKEVDTILDMLIDKIENEEENQIGESSLEKFLSKENGIIPNHQVDSIPNHQVDSTSLNAKVTVHQKPICFEKTSHNTIDIVMEDNNSMTEKTLKNASNSTRDTGSDMDIDNDRKGDTDVTSDIDMHAQCIDSEISIVTFEQSNATVTTSEIVDVPKEEKTFELPASGQKENADVEMNDCTADRSILNQEPVDSSMYESESVPNGKSPAVLDSGVEVKQIENQTKWTLTKFQDEPGDVVKKHTEEEQNSLDHVTIGSEEVSGSCCPQKVENIIMSEQENKPQSTPSVIGEEEEDVTV